MKTGFHLEDVDTLETAPLNSVMDFTSWLSSGGRETLLVLRDKDGSRSVPLPAHVGDEAESLLEIATSITDEWGTTVSDRYRQGDCEVFALALETVFKEQGHLVAIYDEMEPDSDRVTEGEPYLVHSGYRVDDTIYDVDGARPADDWAQTWMENGHCSELSSWGQTTREKLEAAQMQKADEDDIEKALPFARLVKALTGPQAVLAPRMA